MKISGIYKIQSTIKPERIYIGSSVNLLKRKDTHYNKLKNNIHASRKLQNHYNKYGETDLQFSIITTCEIEELLEKEQYFINVYNPWFNTRQIANNNIGIKASEITIQKMSESQKERWRKRKENNKESYFTPEKKKQISNSLHKYWKKQTEEQKKKFTKGLIKGIFSEETRKKLSLACIRRGAIPPSNKGKKMSDETKKKMSDAAKGRIVSIETRRKLSEINKGRISPMLGRHHSEESKIKMRKIHIKKVA